MYQLVRANLLIQKDKNGFIRAMTEFRTIENPTVGILYLYRDLVFVEADFGFMKVVADVWDLNIDFNISLKRLFNIKIGNEKVTLVLDKRLGGLTFVRRVEDTSIHEIFNITSILCVIYNSDIAMDFNSRTALSATEHIPDI